MIQPVTEQDEQQLITGYVEAFRDAFDFCDWDPQNIQTPQETISGRYFPSSEDGSLLFRISPWRRRPSPTKKRLSGRL